MRVKWLTVIVLGLLVATAAIPVVKTHTAVTTVTGMTISETSWFGLPPVIRQKPSPLSLWCREHHVEVREDPMFFSTITRDFWGLGLIRGCGTAPACMFFKADMQSIWLERTSEVDVRKFIAAMTSADEPGRERLIRAALDRMFTKP
ncbi:MAG: hypothetical protein WC661_17175 [Opitutaceae bacterium]|jgi:hypothetical protein